MIIQTGSFSEIDAWWRYKILGISFFGFHKSVFLRWVAEEKLSKLVCFLSWSPSVTCSLWSFWGDLRVAVTVCRLNDFQNGEIGDSIRLCGKKKTEFFRWAVVVWGFVSDLEKKRVVIFVLIGSVEKVFDEERWRFFVESRQFHTIEIKKCLCWLCSVLAKSENNFWMQSEKNVEVEVGWYEWKEKNFVRRLIAMVTGLVSQISVNTWCSYTEQSKIHEQLFSNVSTNCQKQTMDIQSCRNRQLDFLVCQKNITLSLISW